MNNTQIAFLRRLVAQANAADMDVGVSTNILAALLDEHDAHQELVNLCTGVLECLEHNDPWPKRSRDSVKEKMRAALAKAAHDQANREAARIAARLREMEDSDKS